MPSRRQFLHSGMNALALGLLAQRAGALAPPVYPRACLHTGAGRLRDSHPILSPDEAETTFSVDGVNFAGRWFGDPWAFRDMPFHSDEAIYPGGPHGLPGQPPGPQEETDIAIVGGGLSGMATAYLLRHRRPVLFELHPRFGGTSIGEYWRGTSYSLGGAYFISPDPGSSSCMSTHHPSSIRECRNL